MRVGGVAERAVVRERVVAELGRVARVRPRAARRAAPRGGARAVRLAPAGAAPARAGPAAHAARVPPLPAGAPTLHSLCYTQTQVHSMYPHSHSPMERPQHDRHGGFNSSFQTPGCC